MRPGWRTERGEEFSSSEALTRFVFPRKSEMGRGRDAYIGTAPGDDPKEAAQGTAASVVPPSPEVPHTVLHPEKHEPTWMSMPMAEECVLNTSPQALVHEDWSHPVAWTHSRSAVQSASAKQSAMTPPQVLHAQSAQAPVEG